MRSLRPPLRSFGDASRKGRARGTSPRARLAPRLAPRASRTRALRGFPHRFTSSPPRARGALARTAAMSSPVVLAGLALAELHRRAHDGLDGIDSDSEGEEQAETPSPTLSLSSSRERASPARVDAANEARAPAFERDNVDEDATLDADDARSDAEEPREPEHQCRFCFTGRECGSLIAPCACDGSQRFVHRACLRRWLRVSFEQRGAYETCCRVCHEKYDVPARSGASKLRFWFSLRARDRLNEYSRVWAQNAMNALLRRKGVTMPRSASSAGNLALLVASTEVNIWARREEHRSTSALPKALRVASFLLSAASVAAKVRLLFGGATVTVSRPNA